jgi:hypothetical protein
MSGVRKHESTDRSGKRVFVKPRLIHHGKIENITMQSWLSTAPDSFSMGNKGFISPSQ